MRSQPGLALLLGLLAVAACGRVGPPVAPQLREPQPVAELRAAQSEGLIEVSWLNPTQRVNRSPLLDLILLHVFRAEDSGVGEPKAALRSRGRIAGWDEIATVRLADPAPATIQGARVVFPDRQGLAYGRRYTYVILGEDAQGRISPPSNRLSVAYLAPPAPPRNLGATPGEGEVALHWEPPAALVDGSALQGDIAYEVLRGAVSEGPLAAVTAVPVEDTRFTDRGLVNDRTYEYAVRALRIEAGGRAQSEATARLAVTPVDMTAPAAPQRLVAVVAGSDVRLAWAPSPDADVARYVVYRADARGAFVRIGSTTSPTTTFVDRGLAAGVHRYAVTAQDGSSRANESARSDEATALVP
jgi:hypothetical protein